MTAASSDPLARLEAMLDLEQTDVPSRRMLVIVNPYATTVSDRLKNLVVYALRGRYDVHAVDTEARDHATELCREAASEGYDVVVAFGGDGTVNEAANGLVGSDTPLCCLPGGRANVYCRMLGIPADVVDATEHLLGMAYDWKPRRVDVGRVNDRYFTFSAGVGLDASVVEIVDAHPRLKARLGEWYYTWAAVKTFNRRYLVRPLRLRAQIGADSVDGVTAIVQNAASLHVLRRPSGADGRGRRAGQRRPGRHRPAAGQPARRPVDRLARAVGTLARGWPPPRPRLQRRERGAGHEPGRPPAPSPGRRRLHR